MKVEIAKNGTLIIIASTPTDHYALKKWVKSFRKVNKEILKNGRLKNIKWFIEAYDHRK